LQKRAAMNITVRLFAGVREVVGHSTVVLEVPDGTTAGQIMDYLAANHPEAARLRSVTALAVNREYAEGGRVLADGDEVAIIPPVSGGRDLFEIADAPISLDAVVRDVRQDSSGAVASFLGVVRVTARGRTVRYLEYEAYPEMAIARMQEIGEEIRGRWPVDRIAIVHRTGQLEIGEASVAIAVSSPHRREALEACAYAIERLKAIVPIWKKEVWTDGAEWIGSTVDEYRELRAESREPRAEN
jgi:molybdopterin synthase catalytic subunit